MIWAPYVGYKNSRSQFISSLDPIYQVWGKVPPVNFYQHIYISILVEKYWDILGGNIKLSIISSWPNMSDVDYAIIKRWICAEYTCRERDITLK